MDLMKVKINAASRNSHSMMIEDAVVKPTNSNASKAGPVLKTKRPAMVHKIALTVPMKTRNFVVSRVTRCSEAKSVDVKHTNFSAVMVIVSIKTHSVMVNFNALMVLMRTRPMNYAATKASKLIPLRSVAATQKPNGLVPMVTVLLKTPTVMVKPNVPMVLMKVTRNAASENSPSTTTKNVAAKNINGNVTMANVSILNISVMRNTTVPIDLMRSH
jgi:hypothetical protein